MCVGENGGGRGWGWARSGDEALDFSDADEGEEAAETLLGRLRAWLARPRVRAAVFALAAVEAIAVGGWAYVVHGTHLYQLGDEAVGRLTGHPVVYAPACNPQQRGGFVRLVLDRDARAGKAGVSQVGVSQAGGAPVL